METDLPEQYGLFIDGKWVETDETFTVRNPASNEPITEVAEAKAAGVDQAVTSSEEHLPEWAAMDADERGSILHDVADALRDELDYLASVETAESGRPIHESMAIIGDGINYFSYFAGLADKIEGETIPIPGERLDYTVREPLGVTGHVVPWNAAIILGARSFAPALACGNTVVAKPSPEAPCSILEMARIATEAGLPDGVLNVVPGDGQRTGQALTSDERLGSIVFTGSLETGKTVMKTAAENVVPVALELGGKSPSIVFPDADLEQAIEDTIKTTYNTGQVCFATTRLFVHDSVYDEFVDELADRLDNLEFGPGAEGHDLGALISPEAQQNVHSYVRNAVDSGGRLLAGGELPEGPGNFYPATLVDQVADDAPISCDEVFGPVIAAYRFEDETEVIRRANDTDYGLYAVVWTNDLTRAHRVSGAIEAGSIAVNEYPATFPQAPFGGYKQSGIGREKGIQALDHYTQTKNVSISLGDSPGATFDS